MLRKKRPAKYLNESSILRTMTAFVAIFGSVQSLPSVFHHHKHRGNELSLPLMTQLHRAIADSHNSSPASALESARADLLTTPDFKLFALNDTAIAAGLTSSSTSARQHAPSFSLPSLDGKEIALETLRGKVVLLTFWATWCGPCRSEMPALEQLYRDFRAYPDFALLTVNTEQRSMRSLREFIAKNNYDFPVLLDADNAVSAAYGVSALPSAFVIDREGRIVFSHAGALDWSDSSLREALQKLLEKKPKQLPGTIEALVAPLKLTSRAALSLMFNTRTVGAPAFEGIK